MNCVLACGHPRGRSKTGRYEVSAVRSKALGPLIEEEGVRSVQHVHQLLVKASENRPICIASSCLDQTNLDEPAMSIYHLLETKIILKETLVAKPGPLSFE